MKRAYVVRKGAFGDTVHASHLPRILYEEGYEVTFEYNWKGAQILSYNPYIKHHVFAEPTKKELSNDSETNLKTYKKQIQIKREYDKFIDLNASLEGALISDEKSHKYFMPKKWRNEKFGDICFYDQTVKWAGLSDKYYGRVGEIYFRKKEHERMIELFTPIWDRGKRILMWSIAGTMWQKAIYPWSKEVCDEFQRRHPDVVVIVTAGEEYAKHAWGIPIYQDGWQEANAINVVGKWPFRQALLATKYIDMLVTPETGIGIGAGTYGTPKMMLMTAASVKNIVGNDKNDFSIQSEAWCSPCHRAIYNMDICDTVELNGNVSSSIKEMGTEKKLPICVFFDKERVLHQMEKMYEVCCLRERPAASLSRPVYM